MKLNTAELDTFYLSYDEPQKELFWSLINNVVPWAKRVDGVKGFDAAHKQCAFQSDTDYLITVDGDNQVDPRFFNLELTVPDQFHDCVLSWNSINAINGLTYGNGGIKIWPKQFLLNMQSHEAAIDPTHSVDFCWDDKYIQLNNAYSTTHPNGSKLHAFRAGFREGCKMTLDGGKLIKQAEQLTKKVHYKNIERLQIWGSVGQDVEYGIWAVLGTRVGMHYTNVECNDITLVRDYDLFGDYAEPWLKTHTQTLPTILSHLSTEIYQVTGMQFYDFDSNQSKFFKQVLLNGHKNIDPLTTEREIFANV